MTSWHERESGRSIDLIAPRRRSARDTLRAARGPLLAAAVTLGTLAAVLAAPAVASANAANPLPTTSGTAVVNGDGSVTVTLQGTWSWPGQACSGRYGVGWAVDWWGISTAKAPTDPFSLTDATEVVAAGPAGHVWDATATTTGTATPAGSIQLPKSPPPPPKPGVPPPPPPPPSFFHVGAAYSGEDTDLCATVEPDGTPEGSWSATATYPSQADIPATLCVNLYDEHGSAGKSSGNANDFSPVKDGDNSIQTNDFDPSTASDSSCMSSANLVVSGGGGGTD